MTCDHVTLRLSEYLDHSLTSDERQEVADHLATCLTCQGLLDDLSRIAHDARTLGPITPPAHLWLEIAGRLRLDQEHAPATPASASAPVTTRRALASSRGSDMWQWFGLAAGLILVTAAVYVIARPDAPPPDTAVVSNADAPVTVETFEDTLRRAEAEYERAIVMLEQIINAGGTSMTPESLDTLKKNVTAIDTAIAESRAVLTDNPASQPARTSLFDALASKVNLLQSTVVLMNEMRKGDAGGAADAAAGLDKKTS
jgi:hypothetical protein